MILLSMDMQGSHGQGRARPMSRHLLGSASLAVVGWLAFAAPGSAIAQDAGAASPIAAVTAVADNSVEASADQEIVVTGSRISKRDQSSNTPILTVGGTQLENNSSVQLEAKLSAMPQFAGAASQFNSGGVNSTGQANINMRGLGANRNLVLLDGRRLQPSTSALTIDINTIPSALIENVEVITGGASAVYGSDAISGVVNFKTKQHFSGVQIDAQGGISERGDGATLNVSAVGGGQFADGRGQATFAMDYYDRRPIEAYNRSFYTDAFTHGGAGAASNTLPTGTYLPDAANLANSGVIASVFSRYGVASTITPSTVLGFNNDGTLFTDTNGVRNYKGLGTADGYATTAGGTLVYDPNAVSQIQSPLTRYSGFGKLTYDLTDAIQVYGQFLFSSIKTSTNGSGTQAVGVGQYALSVPVTNPFIPADLKTILASRANPTANFTVVKRFNQLGLRVYDLDTELSQFVVGAKGRLGIKDWTWDISASHGRTTYVQTYAEGHAYLSLIQKLLTAPDGGASLCTGGFNVFGDVPISASCGAYVKRSPQNRTTLTQDVVEATLQGGLFNLPAGEVRFAAGANYRRNTYDFNPDSVLRNNPPDLLAVNSAAPTSGKTKVSEGYIELSIPVVNDVPFIRSLEINPAYRYSSYDLTGGIHTYKVDFGWEVVSQLRIRGGYERAVRAPNIGELYTGALYPQNVIPAVTTAGGGDPCDVRSSYRTGASAAQVRTLCLAQGVPNSAIDIYTSNFNQFTGVTQGNTALKPEKADTFTIGAVWRSEIQSPWLKNLSFSADFYKINLKQAIGTISGNTTLYNCFNANGQNSGYDASNLYCQQISRTAVGDIRLVNQPYLNLGGYKTRGVDFQANWSVLLPDVGLGASAGRFSLDLAGTYLDRFEIQNLPGAAFLNYTGTIGSGTPYARWKTITTATYQRGAVDLGLRWHYLSGMDDSTRVSNPARELAGVNAYNTFDLFVNAKLNKTLSLRAGIDNFTDKKPLIVGAVYGNTDVNTYDPIGRRFYLAVRAKY